MSTEFLRHSFKRILQNSDLIGKVAGFNYYLFQPTKLFDWEPDPYYNLTEVEHHPTMPQNVKNNISIDTIQCFEKKKI